MCLWHFCRLIFPLLSSHCYRVAPQGTLWNCNWCKNLIGRFLCIKYMFRDILKSWWNLLCSLLGCSSFLLCENVFLHWVQYQMHCFMYCQYNVKYCLWHCDRYLKIQEDHSYFGKLPRPYMQIEFLIFQCEDYQNGNHA